MSGGYWDNSSYDDIWEPMTLYYTNVFFVDMQLWQTYYVYPNRHRTILEQQYVIVDETGTILFVSWTHWFIRLVA
jgi:hypothetical protein